MATDDLHPNPATRWKNRRRMAWTSLFSLIGFGCGAMINDLSNAQSSVVVAVVYGCTAIIGAYVGFATWDDKR